MNLARILSSYYRRNALSCCHGPRTPYLVPARIPGISIFDQGHWNSAEGQGFSSSGRNRSLHIGRETKMKSQESSKTPSPSPQPSKFNLNSWAKWFLGAVLALALPFWSKNWQRLILIESNVEKIVEAVEVAAEAVEKVATVAEKLSLELAEKLPEDGRLKDAAQFVENMAEVVAEEAQVTQGIIHKMDELKQDLEVLLEPGKQHIDREGSHDGKQTS